MVYGDKQFKNSIKHDFLPNGFIKYHSNNFAKTLGLNIEDFEGLRILDTGCGPGKHAAVLALMKAEVVALDFTPKNIEKGNEIKRRLGLNNIEFHTFDLTKSVEEFGKFDAITAHNWIQHSENPSLVMRNLTEVLNTGGRFYISTYHARNFRFVICQIARSVLKREDYSTVESIARFAFPQGFAVFGNYHDIYFENIFDDFFVPFCHTITYDELCEDAEKMGLFPINDVPEEQTMYHLDNHYLKIAFEKRQNVSFPKDRYNFVAPYDELSSSIEEVKAVRETAFKAIDYFASCDSSLKRSLFAIGLYRLRAELNAVNDVADKFSKLKFYLEQSMDDTNWPISFFNPEFSKAFGL